MLNPQFVKNEERLAKMFKQDRNEGRLPGKKSPKSPKSIVSLEGNDKASLDSDDDPMKRYKKAYKPKSKINDE